MQLQSGYSFSTSFMLKVKVDYALRHINCSWTHPIFFITVWIKLKTERTNIVPSCYRRGSLETLGNSSSLVSTELLSTTKFLIDWCRVPWSLEVNLSSHATRCQTRASQVWMVAASPQLLFQFNSFSRENQYQKFWHNHFTRLSHYELRIPRGTAKHN